MRFADGCTLNKPTIVANADWLLPVSLWTRNMIGTWSGARNFPGVEKFHDLYRKPHSVRVANVSVFTDKGEA